MWAAGPCDKITSTYRLEVVLTYGFVLAVLVTVVLYVSGQLLFFCSTAAPLLPATFKCEYSFIRGPILWISLHTSNFPLHCSQLLLT